MYVRVRVRVNTTTVNFDRLSLIFIKGLPTADQENPERYLSSSVTNGTWYNS